MLYFCMEASTGGNAGVSAQEKPLQVIRYVHARTEDQDRDGVSMRAQQVKLKA